MTLTPERACHGKVRHLDRKAARRAAKKYPSEHLAAYACPFCDFFHLGHVSQWARAAARELRATP